MCVGQRAVVDAFRPSPRHTTRLGGGGARARPRWGGLMQRARLPRTPARRVSLSPARASAGTPRPARRLLEVTCPRATAAKRRCEPAARQHRRRSPIGAASSTDSDRSPVARCTPAPGSPRRCAPSAQTSKAPNRWPMPSSGAGRTARRATPSSCLRSADSGTDGRVPGPSLARPWRWRGPGPAANASRAPAGPSALPEADSRRRIDCSSPAEPALPTAVSPPTP